MNFLKKLVTCEVIVIKPPFAQILLDTLEKREKQTGFFWSAILTSVLAGYIENPGEYDFKKSLVSHATLIKFLYPLIEQLDALVDKEISFTNFKEVEKKIVLDDS